MRSRRFLVPCAVVFGVALLSIAAPVLAQSSYPVRPIRLVVPYPPGGGVDNIARPLAQKLSEALGQPVVIDNRGGASGIIGADIVAKSKPDGYTLLLHAMAHAVNPALHKMPFDTLKDFAPVGMVVINPLILVANPALPATTVQDVIAIAKQTPGHVSFASMGVGSGPHLAGELLKYTAKVDIVDVPYKGGGPALADVMGGQVQMCFVNIASGLPHVKSGKLKAIAVSSTTRSRSAPEVPTVAESGVPGFDLYEWNAVFAPAGTPPDIIARLNAEIGKILRSPEMQERFFQVGAEAAPGTPEQLDVFVRNETEKWSKFVKEVGIKAE